jgi:Bacterial NAD-glutamate dehydrogenase
LKLYLAGLRITLSEVLPVLQQMDIAVIDERPYEVIRGDGVHCWIYDFGLRLDATVLAGRDIEDTQRRFKRIPVSVQLRRVLGISGNITELSRRSLSGRSCCARHSCCPTAELAPTSSLPRRPTLTSPTRLMTRSGTRPADHPSGDPPWSGPEIVDLADPGAVCGPGVRGGGADVAGAVRPDGAGQARTDQQGSGQ